MADSKSRRRVANLSQALAYTIIFIAILVTINFLANRYNKSVDSTASKRYSLSDQSAKLAKDLKDKMLITYWDKPSEFEHARGLMDRYQNLSNKIEVQYHDPDQDRTAAMAAGVTAYGTTVIQVGDKKETAKTLTEEDVTNAMVRALKGGDRTVCFVQAGGEAAIDDTMPRGYSAVKELAEKGNYKTKTIKLLDKAEIPMDCTLIVVGGPRRDYIAPVVAALKMYVEGGGRAMFLLDPPLRINPQAQVDDNAELVAVLDGWGAKVQKNLVLDLSEAAQSFGAGPQAPLVESYTDHVIMRPLKLATIFPLVRSIEVATTATTKVSPLLSSSEESRATRELASQNVDLKGAKDKGPLVLAVAGEFSNGSKGRFVVVGTSQWIANGYLKFNGNRDLFMNMVNWLSSDEDLISIRPKEPEDRPLNMNARQVTMLFYTSVLGIPLLVVLAGVGVWWKRR